MTAILYSGLTVTYIKLLLTYLITVFLCLRMNIVIHIVFISKIQFFVLIQFTLQILCHVVVLTTRCYFCFVLNVGVFSFVPCSLMSRWYDNKMAIKEDNLKTLIEGHSVNVNLFCIF